MCVPVCERDMLNCWSTQCSRPVAFSCAISAVVAPNEACERKRTAPGSSGMVACALAVVFELTFSPPPHAASNTDMAVAMSKLRVVLRSVFIRVLAMQLRCCDLLRVAWSCFRDGVRRLGSVFERVHPANELASERASSHCENFACDGGKRSPAATFLLSATLLYAPLHSAIAQDDAALSALAPALRESLRSTGLPSSAFAIVVRPLGRIGVNIGFNDAVAMS